MRQGNFPGARILSPADQRGNRRAVMRGAEWPGDHQAAAGRQPSADGMDPCGFQGFLKSHRGQNPGNTPCQHGFSAPGNTDHNQVMAACGGNLKGSAGSGLPADLGHIDCTYRLALQLLKGNRGLRGNVLCSVQIVDDFTKMGNRNNPKTFNAGSFPGVPGGQDDLFYPILFRTDYHGKHAVHTADTAVQAELPEERSAVRIKIIPGE